MTTANRAADAPASVAPLASPPLTAAKPFYRPELDCLRFFAFLCVFIHHTLPKVPEFYRERHLPERLANIPYAGSFGVDLFFCLSAYIITELLLREVALRGGVDVFAFYVRRALRIWPLYFAFVGFSFALTFFDATQVFSGRDLVMFLALLGNWAAAGGNILSVVLPLWSVSIEEQFYLFWPLVLRRGRRELLFRMCFAMIAIAFVWRSIIVATVQDPKRSEFLIWNGTFSHFDVFAYGILLALIGPLPRVSPWTRVALLAMGGACWYAGAVLQHRGDVMMALVAIGSVSLLMGTIGLEAHNRVLIRLGVVSYGLYVFHELALLCVGKLLPHTHGKNFVIWLVGSLLLTIVFALASYRWLESPFLRMKKRFTFVASRPV
jgi:peptidoglycan/LPS O-acetylase OafA/YrhL